MDLLIWGGIADLVNTFREETLKLPPIFLTDGATLLDDNEVPFTYLWPPSLVAKPADWGPHIDLGNFTFYDQARTYEPPRALLDFLATGEPPIYVGFGSVVVEDPAAVRRIVFTALEKAGARGIVSDGWGRLTGEAPPPHVFQIGDTPHDWLFARCRAVCHHGGAGTTAAGLRAGLPTVVVPFFGDQFFWGRVIADAGAGPEPIPIDRLDSSRLAEAFEVCRRPAVLERAAALGTAIRETDGVALAVQSVYRHLPVSAMCCADDPSHLATGYCDTCDRRLCPECAGTSHAGHVIHPYRDVDWSVRPGRGLTEEMGDLIGDTVKALQAGLEEIMPSLGPWHHGVVFKRGDEPSDAEGPVPLGERGAQKFPVARA